MKKLIALLSISAFIGGCAKEPTQLEKCIDINSKKIIAEMKNNYEEFPESVLDSRIERNKDFDEEHAKKQYPLLLKQMANKKSLLDRNTIGFEEYESYVVGSYDEYEASMKNWDVDTLGDLFESKEFFTKHLNVIEFDQITKNLNLNNINILDKYIDHQLNLSHIKDMLKTSLVSGASEFCNSQGIY